MRSFRLHKKNHNIIFPLQFPFKQLLSNFEPQNCEKNKQLLGLRSDSSCLYKKSVIIMISKLGTGVTKKTHRWWHEIWPNDSHINETRRWWKNNQQNPRVKPKNQPMTKISTKFPPMAPPVEFHQWTEAGCSYLSVFLSFCLSVFLSFCLSVFLSFCLSVFQNGWVYPT